MKNILISVIIPVYNSEKYIYRCVESIMNQTHHNLEILLIDDGSSDNSFKICEELANQDTRIKVIHKKNGGASSARNMGLQLAKGSYIGFVDSDDYVDSRMYEELLKSIVKYDSMMSICGYYCVDVNDKKINNIYSEYETITSMQLMNDIYTYRCMGVLWNKLFKKEIFIEENQLILFDEKIHFCEDVLMLTKIFQKTKTIACCNNVLYYYIISNISLCHGEINDRKYSMLLALNSIEEHTRNTSTYDCSSFFIVTSLIYLYTNLIDSSKVTDKNVKISEMKDVFLALLKNKKIKLSLKLRIVFVLFFPKLYLIIRRYRKH